MRPFPTVKHLIETLELVDTMLSAVCLGWSVLAAWAHPGPMTSDHPDWAQDRLLLA
jgi:hypothetical protein